MLPALAALLEIGVGVAPEELSEELPIPIPVVSGAISDVSWTLDGDLQLTIKGDSYVYSSVPVTTIIGLAKAPSPTRYFSLNIRDAFAYDAL